MSRGRQLFHRECGRWRLARASLLRFQDPARAMHWRATRSSRVQSKTRLSAFALEKNLPHLNQIVFGDTEHNECEAAFHPHHPLTRTRQSCGCSAKQSHHDKQRAHSERESEQIKE